MVFVTLTAPSFGLVHTRRQARTVSRGTAGRAVTPRLPARRAHCRAPSCTTSATRAWASRCVRTATTTRARSCGTTRSASCGAARRSTCAATSPATPASRRREADRRVALAYAQGRRVPAARPRARARDRPARPRDARLPRDEIRRPSARFSVDVLEAAMRSAVAEVHANGSKYLGSARVRWGEELDVRPLADRGEAGAQGRRLPRQVRHQEHRAGRRAAAPRQAIGSRNRRRAPPRACSPARRVRAARPSRTAKPTRCAARTPPPPRPRRASTRRPPAAATRTSSRTARFRRSRASERVRIRVRGERRDRRVRITACGDAEPRGEFALELTLHTGERVHLADVALIAHATPRLRDRHDPRLAACAHQFGHRGHCLTKSRRYSTTLTALREARHEHAVQTQNRPLGSDGRSSSRSPPSSPGCGSTVCATPAKGISQPPTRCWPHSAAARAREQRRAAREARAMDVEMGGRG